MALKPCGERERSPILMTERLTDQRTMTRTISASVRPKRGPSSGLAMRVSGSFLRSGLVVRSVGRPSSPARPGPREAGLDDRGEAAAGVELAPDDGALRPASADDVLKDAVDDVLVEDAQVPISQEIFLEGLELQDLRGRDVTERDRPEIRQARFRADRGELGELDGDLVVGELIGERFERRQLGVQAGLGLALRVSGHGRTPNLLNRDMILEFRRPGNGTFPGTGRILIIEG